MAIIKYIYNKYISLNIYVIVYINIYTDVENNHVDTKGVGWDDLGGWD